jgi:glycerol uptake facilitator-like aquaporin
MATEFPRRLLAEAVGTAILVLFGAGSVVAALTVRDTLDYPALGMVGIAFALAIAVAIYAFGTTSGAGDAHWGDLPAYVFGPVIGAGLATVGYDAIARPREFDQPEPAQGTQGDIEGHAEVGAERAAAPAHQGTSGDIAGRRV